jgi:ornithine cyclodeaminase/alanine dehydrogenase-like protein (mu-crystallin family)
MGRGSINSPLSIKTKARIFSFSDASICRARADNSCGFQGSMHLRFMTAFLPGIKAVRLRDVRADSMASLKRQATGFFAGEIRICSDNGSCIRGADIISTCTNGDEQIIAIPIGMAICDIALAHLIYQTSLERNIGQRLNLM